MTGPPGSATPTTTSPGPKGGTHRPDQRTAPLPATPLLRPLTDLRDDQDQARTRDLHPPIGRPGRRGLDALAARPPVRSRTRRGVGRRGTTSRSLLRLFLLRLREWRSRSRRPRRAGGGASLVSSRPQAWPSPCARRPSSSSRPSSRRAPSAARSSRCGSRPPVGGGLFAAAVLRGLGGGLPLAPGLGGVGLLEPGRGAVLGGLALAGRPCCGRPARSRGLLAAVGGLLLEAGRRASLSARSSRSTPRWAMPCRRAACRRACRPVPIARSTITRGRRSPAAAPDRRLSTATRGSRAIS